jgi:CRP-like cAMP-binding protein
VIDQPISLESAVVFLMSVPLFDRLDPAELAEVTRIMEVRRLIAGEEVFHEGDPGDAWYVVFEGQAQVFEESEGRVHEIAAIGRGSAFGEMAILDGRPRSATVRAREPLTLFRFRESRFSELLDEGSLAAYKLVLAMARMLSVRHRELTRQLSDSPVHNGVYQISE